MIIIEWSSEAFHRLSIDFSGFEVAGDATDSDVLQKAGIIDMGMLIAVTENDNVNCMIAQIAK